MKITKQKLIQIIKEELAEATDWYGDLEAEEEDEYDGLSTDELNRTESICFKIFHDMQDLSAKWRPQTVEGQVYKEDLDAVLAQMNGGEEY